MFFSDMMCQNASRLIEGTYTHPLFLQSAHCSNAPTLTLLTITRTMSVPCLTSKPALVYINQGEISSSFPRDTVHHTRIILAQHVRVYYCLYDTTVYCTCARFKRTVQPPSTEVIYSFCASGLCVLNKSRSFVCLKGDCDVTLSSSQTQMQAFVLDEQRKAQRSVDLNSL